MNLSKLDPRPRLKLQAATLFLLPLIAACGKPEPRLTPQEKQQIFAALGSTQKVAAIQHQIGGSEAKLQKLSSASTAAEDAGKSPANANETVTAALAKGLCTAAAESKGKKEEAEAVATASVNGKECPLDLSIESKTEKKEDSLKRTSVLKFKSKDGEAPAFGELTSLEVTEEGTTRSDEVVERLDETLTIAGNSTALGQFKVALQARTEKSSSVQTLTAKITITIGQIQGHIELNAKKKEGKLEKTATLNGEALTDSELALLGFSPAL